MKTQNPFVAVLFTLVAILLFPIQAHAYARYYHFYLTYTLSYLCGLPDADSIAWADQNTDLYPGCSPGVRPEEWADPSKVEDRRLFHFPVDKDSTRSTSRQPHPTFNGVVRDSPAARAHVKLALEATVSDPVLLGLGLHTYQDSWAHEGFGPVFGHLFKGTGPDLPYRDIPRAIEMAEATWGVLERWSMRVRGVSCQVEWNKVEPMITTWSAEHLDSGDEIGDYWREQLKLLSGRELRPEDLFDQVLETRFEAHVAELKKESSF